MDYKEKYENALDWIHSVYPTMQGADKEDAEHFFPELKESEDEKIRKQIISYLNSKMEKSNFGGDIAVYQNWIAWLEKQGDYDELVEEIIRYKKLFSKEILEEKASINDKLSLGGRIAVLEELLAFTKEKQGEQKPAWSEEDTIRLNQTIYVLHQQGYSDVENWLKTLNPQKINVE